MEKHSDHSPATPSTDRYMQFVAPTAKLLNMFYDIDAHGFENIDSQPAMYVANHLRFADSLLFAAAYAQHFGKPLRLGAKSEYFDGKGINNKGLFGRSVKKFVEVTGQIPVSRESNPRALVELSRAVKQTFDAGESVLLHAEGSRSPDQKLYKFKHGAAALAIKNSVPLVPVSVQYRDNRGLRRTDATITFGQQLIPPRYGLEFHHYPMQSDRISAITDELEQSVATLSGQERSDTFIDPYNKAP